VGDALGMPAQTLTPAEIRARYGRIDDFVAPFEGHPVSHGLGEAQITDDTEQTLLLARRLIADPEGFDDAGWAQDLLTWQAGIEARGLSDLLGPSSKAAIEALLAGTPPDRTGCRGTTNGAAMRIAPVGIMTAPDAGSVATRVARTSRLTHNTGEAIAAASAVAMIVSCGVSGMDFDAAIDPALAAARYGQRLGHAVGEPDIAARIALALRLADTGDEAALLAAIGSSVASRESVPMAFGLLRIARGDLWSALLAAVNIGGDTDSIAAIAGAMGGATGGTLSGSAGTRVMAANDLDLASVAFALVAIRAAQEVA
jgi:ADP-ribosylglycohydrolase